MATDTANNTGITGRALDFWSGLSQAWRMMLLGLSLLIVLLCGYYFALATQTDPRLVPLFNGASFTTEERVEAFRAFASAGLSGAESVGDVILVPKDRESQFISALPADAVPGDLEAAFEEYIANDAWWKSREEAQRQFRVYASKGLARKIMLFPEVSNASVTVTEPPRVGLRRSGRVKASVAVATRKSAPLSPRRVKEIQNLVSHSFSDLAAEDVFVVANSPIGAHSGVLGSPVDTELAKMEDKALQTKEAYRETVEYNIHRALAHLPGVIVVANVEVAPTQNIHQRIVTYDKGTPVSTDTTTLSEETPVGAKAGGPPGVRTNVDAPATVPNQGASTAQAAVATTSDETSSTVYNNNRMETTREGQDFRPRLVGVIVNVPREHLEPTTTQDAQGQPQVQAAASSEQDIVEAIARLNFPGLTAELIKVVPISAAAADEEAATAGVLATSLELLGRNVMDVVYLVLGIIAVVAALVLARRAPVPEVIRAVSDEDEEPEEEEIGLPEVEKNEATARAEKMQESITEIVASHPDAAAALVRRWLQSED